jgi:hypothetical protein
VTCASGKRLLDGETAREDARRLRLRAYRCSRCGGWHLTKRRKVRPRVVKLSARECEGIWAA